MIMGIKTAGEYGELVLVEKDGTLAANQKLVLDSTLSEKILPSINELLRSKGLKPSDLTKIVVFSGPGSFTSLRVGHSVGNTLALGLKIPLAGIKESELVGDFKSSVYKASKKAREGAILVPFYGKKPNITKPKKKN